MKTKIKNNSKNELNKEKIKDNVSSIEKRRIIKNKILKRTMKKNKNENIKEGNKKEE